MNHIGHGVTMLSAYQIALVEALKTASSNLAECLAIYSKHVFCSLYVD